MAGTEVFGIAAVTVMVTAYALEARSSVFVLLFAVSCLSASVYAVLIHAWPFAVVEAIWGIIAFRRWQQRRLMLAPGPNGSRAKQRFEQHSTRPPGPQ